MQNLYAEENRVWVTSDEIPENLVYATIAIEDKDFLKHQGVDWYRTAGAFVNMFLGMKNTFGGSTITQQLIKNLTEDNEATVQRKILEIFRALEFERNYSKEEIMEWYLNYVYFGEGCYGVYSASYLYFGKPVSELDLAECASLIGITNNPSEFDPYISRDRNKYRQELILFEMKDQGIITEEEYDAAVAEELNFQRGEEEDAPVKVYSWYVDQVITDVIDDLSKKYDISEKVASQLVYSGGYQIYSNMDPEIQAAVDSVYNDTENLPYVSSKSGQQLQSAITIIDPKNGYVVATAGGMGEKTSSRGWSRAVNSLRPPGSSIKPLSVYAPALELGLILPNTVLDDTPYMVLDDSFWPVNVDGIYSGLTTVYNAVRVSKNTIAVKLLSQVTPDFSYECLTNKFGITSLVKQQEKDGKILSDIDLAPLALGGLTNGVSTLEMAAAYSVFANDGIYTEPTTYSKVLDSAGNVILDNTPKSSVVLSEKTVFYINNMLEGVVSSGTGTRARFDDMTIAGKTGTTSSKKDTWFVGYTPYYVGAVWVGYDAQERIDVKISQPPILWQKVMSKVHEGLENKTLKAPRTPISSRRPIAWTAAFWPRMTARTTRAAAG
jgi:penicillin-binding protein 1A